jgi:chromosome partitioning related protein ParA
MKVISVISTKGGVGKTTIAANLGAFFADAGLRVLLLDLDIQPTLSSYYVLTHRAGGIYELLAHNESALDRLISRTTIERLDVVISNDVHRQLGTLLLHAPDGRLRLRNMLPTFQHYDVLLIDTQGARSVLLEMSVLASDMVLSPITPEILAARELQRGTLQLMDEIAPYRRLGIVPPPLRLLVNRMPTVSSNARLIRDAVRLAFQDASGGQVLRTEVPAIEAFPRAATRALPAYRLERRAPSGRLTPSALEIVRALATELCPQWEAQFALLDGTRGHNIEMDACHDKCA